MTFKPTQEYWDKKIKTIEVAIENTEIALQICFQDYEGINYKRRIEAHEAQIASHKQALQRAKNHKM